ncbi:MAG: tRNA dihydrouridine synthase DusB [Clostridia bacterium]
MNKLKIGNLKIDGNLFLAPMAGVTDTAFRNICADFGASAVVTEMISAKAMTYGDKKTNLLADLSRDTSVVGLQLFGSEPDVLAKAGQLSLKYKPSFIDINMGCPVPKIAGNNCGSALMKDPKLCGQLVKALANAVDVPVTVKIRKGWDKNSVNALEVAKYCEDSGAKAVFIHGRTREQMYKPTADWGIIRELKENLSVPIIGNGDVVDPLSAVKMLEETKCDGIMIGRAALGNPWIFKDINAYMKAEFILPEVSLAEKLLTLRKHIEKMCEYKGEEKGMIEARKHVAWYISGIKNAAEFRRRSGMLKTMDDLDNLIKDIYLNEKM